MHQLQSHYCQQCTHIIANWILEIDYHIINFFMMDFLNMILHICQLQFSHTFYCNQCGHFFFFDLLTNALNPYGNTMIL